MFRRSGFYVMVIVLTATIVRNASRSHPKIIGGHPISIRQRPFMVPIPFAPLYTVTLIFLIIRFKKFQLSLHNSHRFICGASILSQKLGITALHCLISATSMEYHVRAGSTKINKGGTIHNITNVYIYNDSFHSQLYPKMLRHDIVIFKVSPHFQFSKMVRPVLLAKTIEKPPAKLFVSGWGYSELRTDDDSHGNLMGVYVHHVPFEICVKATPDYAVLVKKDYHLCYGTPGRDSCYGDSGGPLANRNTLYGIVSFGYSCGEVSGVYVKVSYYRRWIKEIMKS